MAGPFADGSGAMLVFDVSDALQFAALVGEDPYYLTLGVTIVRRQQWSPILPEEARVAVGRATGGRPVAAERVPGQ